MFKIRRSNEVGRAVFALSGRIEQAHLPELHEILQTEPGVPDITLDLQEVKLVDREAIRFLAACEAKGMELTNCPAYVRKWIDTRSEISDEP